MSEHRRRTYRMVEEVFATLQEWGLTDVVVSPGSRSTPLAVTADATESLAVHVVLDERCAGFVAVGLAKVTGRMVGLVCTSGSAPAHYFPAVVEASRDRVPLVVLSADRPPGFLERDAPQTINQLNLFGAQVRRFVSLPPAHEANFKEVSGSVAEVASDAVSPNAGPIHINLPFGKPLEPPPGWKVVPGRGKHPPGPEVVPGTPTPESVRDLTRFMGMTGRGVIVAGVRRTDRAEREALSRLGEACGWPILADPLSGMRTGTLPGVVSTGEILLADPEWPELHAPEAVLWVGGTPTGRFTQQWLESLTAPVTVLDPDSRWTAPGPELVVRDPIASLLEQVETDADQEWRHMWQTADRHAGLRRRQEIKQHPGTEIAAVAAVLDSERSVWVGSSMPVRHVDLMMEAGSPAQVWGNRGACGIDGAVACGAGAALAGGGRVTVVLGDLSFIHDLSSLPAAVRWQVQLTIVVLDNRGGAIFDMLPIAQAPGVDFGRLFTTSHSLDICGAANALGAVSYRVTAPELPAALEQAHQEKKVSVLVVDCDADQMWSAYKRLLEQGRS